MGLGEGGGAEGEEQEGPRHRPGSTFEGHRRHSFVSPSPRLPGGLVTPGAGAGSREPGRGGSGGGRGGGAGRFEREHLKFRLAQVWVPYLSAQPPSFQPGAPPLGR